MAEDPLTTCKEVKAIDRAMACLAILIVLLSYIGTSLDEGNWFLWIVEGIAND